MLVPNETLVSLSRHALRAEPKEGTPEHLHWQAVMEILFTVTTSSSAVPIPSTKETPMTTELTDAQKEALRQFAGDSDALLEEASDPSSPLHALFDWTSDDEEAEGARREIAESLIADSNKPAGGDDDEAAAAATKGEAAPAGDDDEAA